MAPSTLAPVLTVSVYFSFCLTACYSFKEQASSKQTLFVLPYREPRAIARKLNLGPSSPDGRQFARRPTEGLGGRPPHNAQGRDGRQTTQAGHCLPTKKNGGVFQSRLGYGIKSRFAFTHNPVGGSELRADIPEPSTSTGGKRRSQRGILRGSQATFGAIIENRFFVTPSQSEPYQRSLSRNR